MALVIVLTLSSVAAAQAPAASPDPTPTPTSVDEIGTWVSPPRITGLPQYPLPDIKIGPVASQTGYARPTAAERRKRYINSLVGPVTIGRQVFNAGVSTWQNSPEEWGTKWEGFGRRFASNVGRNAIRQTILYGLDSALDVDSHFYRSKKKDFGSRFRNAVISPVAARDRKGKRVVSVPRIAATYTSSIVAYEAWYPERYDWKDGVRSGTISLGFNAAFNLFKEFVWKK
jgi:hypothetical protein